MFWFLRVNVYVVFYAQLNYDIFYLIELVELFDSLEVVGFYELQPHFQIHNVLCELFWKFQRSLRVEAVIDKLSLIGVDMLWMVFFFKQVKQAHIMESGEYFIT